MIATRTGVQFRSVEHDEETGIHRFEYETDATSASLAVVAALSEVMGTGPTELGPLNDVIDTDALDDVIRTRATAEGGVRVTLSVEGYSVIVQGDGIVTVTAPGRGGGGRSSSMTGRPPSRDGRSRSTSEAALQNELQS